LAEIRTGDITCGRPARKSFIYATPLLIVATPNTSAPHSRIVGLGIKFKLREIRQRQTGEKHVRGSIENIYTISDEFGINSFKIKDLLLQLSEIINFF
jgi:hypothetical protein